jgi:hypothetical protein
MYEMIVFGLSFLTNVDQWINLFTVSSSKGQVTTRHVCVVNDSKQFRALIIWSHVLFAYAAEISSVRKFDRPRMRSILGSPRRVEYLGCTERILDQILIYGNIAHKSFYLA